MSDTELYLKLHLLEDGSDNERLRKASTRLIEDFNASYINATLSSQENIDEPDNSKGDPFTIGALILVTIPTVLPQVFNFLQSWVIERRKIVLEAPNGAKVEFVPDKKLSQEEILLFLEKLNKLQKKK